MYKAGKTNVNADALSRNPVEASAKQIHENARILPVTRRTTPPEPHRSSYNTRQRKAEATTSRAPTPDVTDEHTESDDSTDSDDSEESHDDGDETPNEPPEIKRPKTFRIIHVPDNFLTRSDNLVVFTTQQGKPIGSGAQILAEAGLLPAVKNAPLGRARVNPEGNRQIITLAVKDKISALIEKEILKEAIRSLLDVVIELGLQSISLSKSACDNVPWETTFPPLANTRRYPSAGLRVRKRDNHSPRERPTATYYRNP